MKQAGPSVKEGITFKRITVANWLERDMPAGFSRLTPESWVEYNMQPQLGPNVPPDILSLFEVARGAMIYGWFFYPLITLAAEQCSRVIEAGVKACCGKHGIPTQRLGKDGHPLRTRYGRPSETSHSENIKELVKSQVIPACEAELWDVAREFRNLCSHPERQMIFAPGMALGMLKVTSDCLNELFHSQEGGEGR